FVINLVMITPDYNHGTFNPVWTKDRIEKLRYEIGEHQPISLQIDRFYTSEGVIDCLMRDFTYHNQPITINIHDEHAEGCWLLHEKYVRINNGLYELKGIEYKIPYKRNSSSFTVEGDGIPRVLIKSEDGTINKLLTDSELRKYTFDNDGNYVDL